MHDSWHTFRTRKKKKKEIVSRIFFIRRVENESLKENVILAGEAEENLFQFFDKAG